MITSAVVGVITVPLLVSRLGETSYGLWIVMASLTGYFQFLDLGTRGSVGRYVAFYDSKKDAQALNRTVSSALAILSVAGIIAFAVGMVLTASFQVLFHVPPWQLTEVRIALSIVAINMGLCFFSMAFDAILWGYQRFDLLNLIDVPAALLRLALTFFLVQSSNGLVALATITLTMTVLVAAAKALLAFQERPAMRVRRDHVTRAHIRELFGFGVWQFVTSLAKLSRRSLVPVVIGLAQGVSLVVPFSIAMRLIEFCSNFVIAATGVLSPLATEMQAKDDIERQRELFLKGTLYCSALAFFAITGLVMLGRPTIELWVGSNYNYVATYVTVLAFGCALPMATHVSDSILVGMARMRVLGVLSMADAATGILATLILGFTHDLFSICVAIACSATLFHGILRPLFVCKVLQVSPSSLILRSLVPAVAYNLIPAAFLWCAIRWKTPNSWFYLFMYAILFACIASAAVIVSTTEARQALRRRIA